MDVMEHLLGDECIRYFAAIGQSFTNFENRQVSFTLVGSEMPAFVSKFTINNVSMKRRGSAQETSMVLIRVEQVISANGNYYMVSLLIENADQTGKKSASSRARDSHLSWTSK